MCSGEFYNMSRRFTLIFKNNQVIRVFIRAYIINIWIRKSEAGISQKTPVWLVPLFLSTLKGMELRQF